MNKIYGFFLLLSLASWGYFVYDLNSSRKAGEGLTVCIIKTVTGLPCPSCGTTQSVIHILHGKWLQAAQLNPLGFLAIVLLIIVPLWILHDILRAKNGFYNFYRQCELLIKTKKAVLITFSFLIFANWIWNIYKYLEL